MDTKRDEAYFKTPNPSQLGSEKTGIVLLIGDLDCAWCLMSLVCHVAAAAAAICYRSQTKQKETKDWQPAGNYVESPTHFSREWMAKHPRRSALPLQNQSLPFQARQSAYVKVVH